MANEERFEMRFCEAVPYIDTKHLDICWDFMDNDN